LSLSVSGASTSARRWRNFLVEGARRGEPGILFTLEETPAQIRAVARSFGWDLTALEAQGRLLISYTSPVELSTDRFLGEAPRQIAQVGARRAVLDSVTSMALGVPSPRRFRELVYALTKHLRADGVTPLMTMEVLELLGAEHDHVVDDGGDAVTGELPGIRRGGGPPGTRHVCAQDARDRPHDGAPAFRDR
jgi:KaiC/GvpD/RAD55 family RecA-like ATPase